MDVLLPGRATLGILGGGQLGRMFALAAQRMGYRVAVYAEEGAPAARTADEGWAGEFEDLDRIAGFAQAVDVVTFEFENVPSETVAAAARHAPVRPTGALLHATQNRLREKNALRDLGLPVALFAAVESDADLVEAERTVPGPGIVKTAAWGYDGKGQQRIQGGAEIAGAWRGLDSVPVVVETLVPFEREVSVVAARGTNGAVAVYEPFENAHVDQILDVTRWPARVSERTSSAAREIAGAILEGFDVHGVLCVEMFVLPDGDLLVNEIAPRPHNSGHLTIDAHVCSQFEQQVRAVTGLPVGAVHSVAPAAAMANLLGHLWAPVPQWDRALQHPDIRLHLYGKTEARPGRKMGHLTATGDSADRAEEIVRQARADLTAGQD